MRSRKRAGRPARSGPRRSLGRAREPREAARELREARVGQHETAAELRQAKLPIGTEPGFVFRPCT
jgi:hypothetical protein